MKIIQLPETVHSDVEPLDELINVIMPCKFIIYHDAKIFVWWHTQSAYCYVIILMRLVPRPPGVESGGHFYCYDICKSLW